MKRILFILFTFLSIHSFAQTEKADEFRTTAGILKSVSGTNFKKDTVIIGGKKTLVYRQPNTNTYNTFSVVGDSLKIQTWKLDTATNVYVTSNLDDVYIDNVINKIFDPIFENVCTTDEEIVVKKSDGTFVTRKSYSLNGVQKQPIGNYTALGEDEVIYAQGGSTITLPSCISNCVEKTIYRDACSDGIITVNVSGGGTIDGVHTSRILPVGRGGYTYECVNGNWRIKSEFFEQDQSCALFSLLNSTNANVTVWTTDGQPYSVDWGNGTSSGLIASGTATSTTYGSSFTGSIKICKTCGVSPIYVVYFNSGNWNFDINNLNQFPNLEYVGIYSGITSGDIGNLPNSTIQYENYGQNTTSGDIANLPSGLTYFDTRGQNTTSGDITNLPSGLTYYSNSGQNTTSGDITNLPSGLITYSNSGQNTTSGDIANLPSGLITYSNYGQNTTSGGIANLPSGLMDYVNRGQNTTSGNIANLPSGLTYYENSGQNTTSGGIANLPSGLTYYINIGQNTTSGNIANLPSGLIVYSNSGQNTTSGNIDNLPSGLLNYLNRGQNTTSGDIGNLPSGLTYYENHGQNTVSDYSGGNLNSGISYFSFITASGGLSASEVDALMIELDSTLPGLSYVNITGTNAAPTAASLTARNNMVSNGVTVIHN